MKYLKFHLNFIGKIQNNQLIILIIRTILTVKTFIQVK